jgi:hypothetical protein
MLSRVRSPRCHTARIAVHGYSVTAAVHAPSACGNMTSNRAIGHIPHSAGRGTSLKCHPCIRAAARRAARFRPFCIQSLEFGKKRDCDMTPTSRLNFVCALVLPPSTHATPDSVPLILSWFLPKKATRTEHNSTSVDDALKQERIARWRIGTVASRRFFSIASRVAHCRMEGGRAGACSPPARVAAAMSRFAGSEGDGDESDEVAGSDRTSSSAAAQAGAEWEINSTLVVYCNSNRATLSELVTV